MNEIDKALAKLKDAFVSSRKFAIGLQNIGLEPYQIHGCKLIESQHAITEAMLDLLGVPEDEGGDNSRSCYDDHFNMELDKVVDGEIEWEQFLVSERLNLREWFAAELAEQCGCVTADKFSHSVTRDHRRG